MSSSMIDSPLGGWGVGSGEGLSLGEHPMISVSALGSGQVSGLPLHAALLAFSPRAGPLCLGKGGRWISFSPV